MNQNFYITTTLPYVNSSPHIGFAFEIVAADVISRFKRSSGYHVIFNTGTDEHGQKIYQKALESHQDPQKYTDYFAKHFQDLKQDLNISYTNFIRTTDPKHIKAAQEFWLRCQKNGDIYQDEYETQYCVGCELEKQSSELENSRCPLHPNQELEIRKERNYFFRFSKFQHPLLDYFATNPEFVKPESKMKEILAFVSGGLKDFSISRLKEKMPWGVPVPNDPDHVMYVWFDALVNYISTLGWPRSEAGSDFMKFWPGVQIAGKDNLRQQSAMWQAMLMSAQLPPSKQILINGFISVDGQKMSKSLGNVISPQDMIQRYGIDGTRFILMFIGPIAGDVDINWSKFDTIYNAHLANGVGNIASRLATMASQVGLSANDFVGNAKNLAQINSQLDKFELASATSGLVDYFEQIDAFLSENKPWKQVGDQKRHTLVVAINRLLDGVMVLQHFIPESAQKILDHFNQPTISPINPIFPRLV